MAEEDKNPTFHIHNCPQDLIDRVKAKAALARKSKDLWVVELLQRETKKLILSRLSWKWRERSSVKIAERTYEERA
jgi:hypothetical protein